jgi:hypothetical protein
VCSSDLSLREGADYPGEPAMARDTNRINAPALDATVPMGGGAKPSPGNRGLKIRLSFIRSAAGTAPFEASLTGTLTIGRSKPGCDLVIANDKEVSRKHCQLLLDNGALKIMDLGSQNGTMVNGVPITGRYRLKHDDVILIGKTEMRIAFT